MFSRLSSYQTLPVTPTAVKVKFKLISLLFKFFHICAQFIIIFFCYMNLQLQANLLSLNIICAP